MTTTKTTLELLTNLYNEGNKRTFNASLLKEHGVKLSDGRSINKANTSIKELHAILVGATEALLCNCSVSTYENLIDKAVKTLNAIIFNYDIEYVADKTIVITNKN